MMLQQFLQDFGYFALFLGTFFEGETILVLAGFLAFRGYMQLEYVVAVAFMGSYAGDQLWYFLGRRHGIYKWLLLPYLVCMGCFTSAMIMAG